VASIGNIFLTVNNRGRESAAIVDRVNRQRFLEPMTMKRFLAVASLGLLMLPAVLFCVSFLFPISFRFSVAPYLVYENEVSHGCFFSLKLIGPAAQAPESELVGCAAPGQLFGVAPRYIHWDFSEDCPDYPPGYQVGAIYSAVYPGCWLALAACAGGALIVYAWLRRTATGRRGFAVSFAVGSSNSDATSTPPMAVDRSALGSSF
jgi:hypothetical protein